MSAGEFSPIMEGRTDLDKYKNSLHELTNAICFKQGGVYSRPGTHFVAEVKTSSKKTRLIPFEFSTSQAYIIEMGDAYLRFYKNSARIESPPGTPVEIASPYLEADLFNVTFAQSADVLYMACHGYAPQKLVRTSDTSWAISAVGFTGSPWGAGPYPACVSLYQQRSWWANTTSAPDTIWGSQTGSYENLSLGTGLANEGIAFTLSGSELNAIQWLIGQRALLPGTSAQEHALTGSTVDDPLTPANPNAKVISHYGSTNIAPVLAGSAILFLQRSARKLREISLQAYSDAYVGPFPDLSILAEHMTLGGITQMAYQQELDSIVWMIRSDGVLIGMTYERAQDVIAWHRHITSGLFQSVASIPHPSGDQEQVWVVVSRTINGTQKRYVEYLDTKGGYYGNLQVDCGLTYPVTTVQIISVSTEIIPGPGGPTTRIIYYAPGHGRSVGNHVTISGVVVDPSGFLDPFNSGGFNGLYFVVDTVPDANNFTLIYGGDVSGYSGIGGSFQITVTPATTLTGLSHLEGRMVDILGNGSVYPQQTVTGGQVVGLSPAVTQAEVGLHFDSTIVTQRPEAGGDSGTAQGGRKRINSVTVRLKDTGSITINGDLDEFRTASNAMDRPVPLFTGDKIVTTMGWDKDARVTIQRTQPLPLIVLATIFVLNVGD